MSKERVLSAAISLADEGGIAALSMRNVARRLGVGVMSLYHYVSDKDAMLAGIVDMVVSEIQHVHDNEDWMTVIRRTAISAHDALLRHPWAANLMFSAGEGPARLDYMESLLRTLRQAGFAPDITHRAYHAIDSHIVGFTLWETSIPFNAAELSNLASAFLQELSGSQYPYLIEHINQHFEASHDESERSFEFGLDLILGSLESMRTPA